MGEEWLSFVGEKPLEGLACAGLLDPATETPAKAFLADPMPPHEMGTGGIPTPLLGQFPLLFLPSDLEPKRLDLLTHAFLPYFPYQAKGQKPVE